MFFANSSASNGYRWTGDAFHVLAIIVILVKFYVTKNANGVSGKTQVLLVLTYTARYFDLWGMGEWISYYNTFMKIFYICISLLMVHFTYRTFKSSYNQDDDSFRIELLLIPVTILAFCVNYGTNMLEITWAWSMYMESIALIPQLYMIWKVGKSESYIITYLFCMALYRGFYIFNWVYRYNVEGHYDLISITGGIIETFVGFVGFLCVVSQALVNLPDSTRAKQWSNPIYTIPLIPDELKSKVGVVQQTKNLPV